MGSRICNEEIVTDEDYSFCLCSILFCLGLLQWQATCQWVEKDLYKVAGWDWNGSLLIVGELCLQRVELCLMLTTVIMGCDAVFLTCT